MVIRYWLFVIEIMHISWLGEGGIKIITKDAQDQKITVFFDPPSPECGLKVRGGISGDIVMLGTAAPSKDLALENISHLLSSQGEYEIKSMPFTGRQIGDIIVWRTEVEGVTIGHLGAINKELGEADRAFFTDCQVLIVPVGGGGVLLPKDAAELVRVLEPKVVIPIYFKIPELKTNREGVEKFCKELPCPQERSDKVSLRKGDIPEEGMKMVILTP